MTLLLAMIIGLLLFVMGGFTVVGYMVYRMVSDHKWDDSNMTNAFRALAHVVVHPTDFGQMYYLTSMEIDALKNLGYDPYMPFWYINKDELSEVVKTRPR